MKLTTFSHRGRSAAGVVLGEEIVDLRAALPAAPATLLDLLAGGAELQAAAQAAADSGRHRIALRDVQLLAPIPHPGKVLAIGLNYRDHIAEIGMQAPEYPTVFNKQATCVVGPGAEVHLPRSSAALDYEGEMAIVIGKRCRHVPRAHAARVIAGYCIMNDVTVRDVQMRTQTWTMGKSFDTHGPLGPWLTTADEVGDPHTLGLRTFVNGELRQQSNTRELLFDCYALVEHLTSAFTLEPGDVISTGTPGGVGMASKPPRWLQAGDVVRIEIDRLGVLENRVVPEPESTVLY
jgi:2-keto-4-pentenoate hydratase/2-oxohepta-3-ene-1,7-dioic acid hydratase in catechol pathway